MCGVLILSDDLDIYIEFIISIVNVDYQLLPFG